MRDDERYIELSDRSAKTANLGAMLITFVIAVATWGDWPAFVVAVVGQGLVFGANVVIAGVLVRRYGPRFDIWRALFNTCVCSVLYELMGWPLPVWLWLPFAALTFHEFGGRRSLVVFAIMCGVQSAAGLACGVSWIYPLSFVGLSIVVRIVTSGRTRVIRDMLADLETAHAELKAEVAARERAELELRQAQKLEAIGRLAAGVAHEINTPMQFIGDSVRFVSEGVTELLSDDTAPVDREYLRDNLPSAITLIESGVGRVASIVKAMRQFAHPKLDSLGYVDLNAAIRDAVTIAKYEYRLVADAELQLADIPLVLCNGGEINQVLLNLIVNAADAIRDVVGDTAGRGQITISTRRDGGSVVIAVADTGTGIPEDVRSRIFDPFFTTKPVGRGTGQGLAIAHAVVERHGGHIAFETQLAAGTTFSVVLPIERAQPRAAA